MNIFLSFSGEGRQRQRKRDPGAPGWPFMDEGRRGGVGKGRRRTPGGVPVGDDGRGGAELGLGLASAGSAQFGGRSFFILTNF